jgi:hypothetical protein
MRSPHATPEHKVALLVGAVKIEVAPVAPIETLVGLRVGKLLGVKAAEAVEVVVRAVTEQAGQIEIEKEAEDFGGYVPSEQLI